MPRAKLALLPSLALTVAALSLGVAACSSEPETSAETKGVDDAIGADAAGGGMAAEKTIADNIAASPVHTSLAAALTQAGLTQTLSNEGPFTLFAPTDAAFTQVPPVTRDGWMRPAQQSVLAGVLNYHVVPGKLTAADLGAQIDAAGGQLTLKTVDGQELMVRKSGDSILLTSASGNKAIVTQADVAQANGVVHVIDAVLLPGM
ncbi:fasciclin domain-containing protein [Sphingopyxis sp. LK2115]|jgi:uncharacterized surface protein with fasciclin (FAS1) repeats|uniref:fasciclin domain-containing protein n=1 Tax=Sphingopyxis sp. LK2115 TaxID=2744558 RepID=UPI0016609F21|nr:fasciclin domain-containing protein [Sphingopyxis sp. LK2115]